VRIEDIVPEDQRPMGEILLDMLIHAPPGFDASHLMRHLEEIAKYGE
jgi:hypothetical protein